MRIDPIDPIDLYSIQNVNPIVPVSKNKRQTPKAVVTKGKNPKEPGEFASLVEDGFSELTKERIAKEGAQREAFDQKVRDLTEKLGDKLKMPSNEEEEKEEP